jgi:glycosyltransferase involved in cell wall biosynthesis
MNRTPQPLVSVVTPVHNDAEFLPECIESILAQTYQNWDYTIINNCSTDRSGEIAREYAARDPRIRVYENREFLKVVPNHNLALRQISPASKYCKVVFADDWIFPECLEKMVAVGEEYPSVGLIGAYGLRGSQVIFSGLPYPSTMVPGRELCRRFFLDQLQIFGSATNVMYRADLVRSHDPFFNEGNLHADTEACIALLRHCDLGFVHQVLTFSRERVGSLNTISLDLNTGFASLLHDLVTYGPDYLAPGEFEMCLKRQLSAYYFYLGKNLLLSRDKWFWEFHRQKMAEVGIRLSRLRTVGGMLGAVADCLLNPKESIERLFRRRRALSLAAQKQNGGTKPVVLTAEQKS